MYIYPQIPLDSTDPHHQAFPANLVFSEPLPGESQTHPQPMLNNGIYAGIGNLVSSTLNVASNQTLLGTWQDRGY